jgi:AcrR family transcriptional regulator
MFLVVEIMARKIKEDWLKAGFILLSEAGEAGLTIDALISRMGVTKGAFYHHFNNRLAYSEALLSFWEQEMTQQVIDQSNIESTAKDRIKRLTSITTRASNPSLEVAIRAWALRDPLVRGYQERVDKKRKAYCIFLSEGLTENMSDAKMLGELIFIVFVGAQQTIPAIKGERLEELYTQLQRMY